MHARAVHVHADAVYPVRFVSASVYTLFATAAVAGTSPPASVITVPVVGVALSTKSFSTAFPPVLLTTVLFSSSVGATSLFVIAQLPDAPSSSVTVLAGLMDAGARARPRRRRVPGQVRLGQRVHPVRDGRRRRHVTARIRDHRTGRRRRAQHEVVLDRVPAGVVEDRLVQRQRRRDIGVRDRAATDAPSSRVMVSPVW